MNKEFNIQDFSNWLLVREDNGYYSTYSQLYDVNYSSILSLLIKEAGKYCTCYASDLFIDWQAVNEYLKQYSDEDEKSYWFGFRDYGVDHEAFIFSRVNESQDLSKCYFALYRLDIKKYHDVCSMVLYKVQ